jgi:hypothetical protein
LLRRASASGLLDIAEPRVCQGSVRQQRDTVSLEKIRCLLAGPLSLDIQRRDEGGQLSLYGLAGYVVRHHALQLQECPPGLNLIHA